MGLRVCIAYAASMIAMSHAQRRWPIGLGLLPLPELLAVFLPLASLMQRRTLKTGGFYSSSRYFILSTPEDHC